MTTPPKRFTEMSVQEILDLAKPDPEYEEVRFKTLLNTGIAK